MYQRYFHHSFPRYFQPIFLLIRLPIWALALSSPTFVSLCCSLHAPSPVLFSDSGELVPTGLSAFKWNFTSLKDLILRRPRIRKCPFTVCHMISAGQVLISAPALRGWATMASAPLAARCFPGLCRLQFQPRGCLWGRRAAFGSSTMDSCGAGRMAQQLRAGAGPAEGSAWRCAGAALGSVALGFSGSRASAQPRPEPNRARPGPGPSGAGLVRNPAEPARVPFTRPGSLHPPMPAARPQGPCLTSRQEDGGTGGPPSPQNPES